MNAVPAAGGVLTIRGVETTDVAALARMFRGLSRESLYFRFFSQLPEVPTSMLIRMAEVDHCRRDALVALDGAEIVAIASYDMVPEPGSQAAEIAVVVADAWQRRGVGLRLTHQLAARAWERDCRTFVARALPDNRAALALVRKLAPRAISRFAGGEYEVRFALDDLAHGRVVPGTRGGNSYAAAS